MRNYRSSCNSLFLFYTNQVHPQNRLKTNHLEGNTCNVYHDTLRIENHGQEKSAVCMRLAVHHVVLAIPGGISGWVLSAI